MYKEAFPFRSCHQTFKNNIHVSENLVLVLVRTMKLFATRKRKQCAFLTLTLTDPDAVCVPHNTCTDITGRRNAGIGV